MLPVTAWKGEHCNGTYWWLRAIQRASEIYLLMLHGQCQQATMKITKYCTAQSTLIWNQWSSNKQLKASWEAVHDVERNEKDASKQVARYFNLSYHSKHHMAVCGLSLNLGSSESHKTLEQIFIFQISTLNPQGINNDDEWEKWIKKTFIHAAWKNNWAYLFLTAT